MENAVNFTNHFLIAMPQLGDPNFFKSVSYVCEHNENGTIAIIINRPLDITLGEVFEQLKIENATEEAKQQPVFFGGPVHPDRGFVIHTPTTLWRSTLELSKDIHVTTSQDILEAIAAGEGPKKFIVALGYAGWGANQLEQEIIANAWLNCPATKEILFDTEPPEQWQAAAKLLGIDISSISDDIGHA